MESNNSISSSLPSSTYLEEILLDCSSFLYLIISAPVYLLYLLRIKTQRQRISHTWLNVSKTITAVVLICLSIYDLIQFLVMSTDKTLDKLSTSSLLTLLPVIGHIVGLMLSLVLIQVSRGCGIHSSGVLFIYWLLLFVSSVTALQFRIRITISQRGAFLYDVLWRGLFTLLIGFQLILSSLVDRSKLALREQVSSATSAARFIGRCSPEMSASFLSKISFWWTTPLVMTGYKRDLIRDDLWSLRTKDRVHSVLPLFDKQWSSAPRLLRALVRTFGRQFLVTTAYNIIHDLLLFASPLLLMRLINFTSDQLLPVSRGYTYAVLMFVVALVQSLIYSQFYQLCLRIGMRIRSTLIAAIYNKSLRMCVSSGQSIECGQITNLISTDVQQLSQLTMSLNTFWSAPLQMIISLVFLWHILGPSILAGLAFMSLMIPLNIIISRKMLSLRVEQMKWKDARMKLTNELLNGIKVLKLYAWEIPFEDRLLIVRDKELKALRSSAYLHAAASFTWTCAPLCVTVVTFAVYILSSLDHVLDAEKAFVSISLFNILRLPLLTLPSLVTSLAQASVSLKRISKFLLSKEFCAKNQPTESYCDVVLRIEKGSFSWDCTTDDVSNNCSEVLNDMKLSSTTNIESVDVDRDEIKVRNLLVVDENVLSEEEMLSRDLFEPMNEAPVSAGEEVNTDMEDIKREGYDIKDVLDFHRREERSTKDVVELSGGIHRLVTLADINLDVLKGSMVAVVGSVGSGKSSLLSALLGEIYKLAGSVTIQEAWIQNATVEDNILFGRHMEAELYERVIDACRLREDLSALPAYDKTEIGEKGVNLSGGQKLRVSLARSVYARTDIYLLDDPLSAVDSHVGQHIFEHVLSNDSGILRGKTRVLVTHDLRYLPLMDKIIVMKNGCIVETGSYQELINNNNAKIFDSLLRHKVVKEEVEEQTEFAIKPKEVLRSTSNEAVFISSLTDDYITRLSRSSLFLPDLSASVELQPGDISVEILDGKSQPITASYSEDQPITASYSQDQTIRGQGRSRSRRQCSSDAEKEVLTEKSHSNSHASPAGNIIHPETINSGAVRWSVYLVYIRSVGLPIALLLLILNIINNIASVGSNLWLSKWTNDESTNIQVVYLSSHNISSVLNTSQISSYDPLMITDPPMLVSTGAHLINESLSNDAAQRNVWLGVYAGIVVVKGLLDMLCAFSMTVFGLRAARKLHFTAVRSLVRVALSFHESTPHGRILNRLSEDMSTVDLVIPFTVRSMLNTVLATIASVAVVSYSMPWFLVAVLPLAVPYLGIQRLYIRASRQLRRLDAVSRSPIYSHFTETLSGLSTIRAYRAEQRFITECQRRIDESSTCYYPTIIIARWLSVRLEFIGNCLVFFAAVFAVTGRDHLMPGTVGLSITYALGITQMLNWLVQMSSEVETNVVAVERVHEYTKLPSEAAWFVEDLPRADWPDQGSIYITALSASYRPDLAPVLHNITCHIAGGEKVGIVGYTGGGKSSLMLALLRIIEPRHGSVVIDGLDTTRVGLHDLRSKLSIIPQEPVLFSGSIRNNLDPFEKFTDDEIWIALDRAHLRTFVSSLPLKLQHLCSSSLSSSSTASSEGAGDIMSVGQKQLMCLARVLLRNTKILILDEATAAVDAQTDELIQQTIRRYFKHSTVLTVAHRLNTIIDYDRILVIDNGYLVEADTPCNLLANQDSLFYLLAKHAGLVHDKTQNSENSGNFDAAA